MNDQERRFLAMVQAGAARQDTGMGSLKDVLNLANPFSRDYFWWQAGRAATGQEDTSPSLLAGSFAPDWFFWGSILTAGAGAAYYLKTRSKKGRR